MNVTKAYAITDAKIQFVSLVDKAANKKQFLITKAEAGTARFASYGRIVKADEKTHYVTGIVYEPMTEDAHGNYMTEEEITKAAYWFAKNGDSVDIQHSFTPLDGATVVENWIAKADFEIGGATVKKGTWLMTVEVADTEAWEAVQKGEITGFSMGGIGNYSEEDVELENVSKQANAPEAGAAEKRSIFKKLATLFGFDLVEKGQMNDEYEKRKKSTLFWEAFYTLQDVLYRYDRFDDRWKFESDEATIREALSEFTAIAEGILTAQEVTKALSAEIPDEKAGTLQTIYASIGNHLTASGSQDQKEEINVTKSELQTIVEEAVKKAVEKPAEDGNGAQGTQVTQTTKAAETNATAATETITAEAVQKMVDEAIVKALEPKQETLTPEAVQDMIAKAVEKAVEPILKSRGVPSNLSDGTTVTKSDEPHFMAGIL